MRGDQLAIVRVRPLDVLGRARDTGHDVAEVAHAEPCERPVHARAVVETEAQAASAHRARELGDVVAPCTPSGLVRMRMRSGPHRVAVRVLGHEDGVPRACRRERAAQPDGSQRALASANLGANPSYVSVSPYVAT